MIIYNSNETDFTHNGLGFLTDIINANVVDALNGEYSLSFEYPTNAKMCEYLVEGNIVKCEVADGAQKIANGNGSQLAAAGKHINAHCLHTVRNCDLCQCGTTQKCRVADGCKLLGDRNSFQ